MEEELDRETERLFAAARRDKPAGALRELVMRGVSRGERARVRARRIVTFGWAAVAAGVGGLVWFTATAARPAANVGAEPEHAPALNPVPVVPTAQVLPSATVPVPVPATPHLAAPSASAPRKPVTARPAVSSPPVADAPVAPPLPVGSASLPLDPPKAPDLSKVMEERK